MPRDRRQLLRLLLPYVVTAITLVWIASTVSVEAVLEELERGDLWAIAPYVLVCVLGTLVLVASADRLVVVSVLGPVRWFDVVRAKAASSLLDLVAYAIGHGVYAVWMGRKTRSSAAVTGGALLYVMAGDLTAVCIVASVSVHLGGAEAGAVGVVAPLIAGTLLLAIAIGPLQLLGGGRVFSPWREIPRTVGVAQIGLRIGLISTVSVCVWAAAAAFGLALPLWVAATYVPVILLVQSLPINVAGFGAVQGAWLLLTPWAPAEQILAFQIAWTLAMAVGITLRGLPFVASVTADVSRSARILQPQ